jgi:hypothetical protein
MKRYIPIIILCIVAIVAIIIRVSNKPEPIGEVQEVPAPLTSTTTTPVKPAVVPVKTTTVPKTNTRPSASYPRGGTYVDTTQYTSSLPDGTIRVSSPIKNAVVTSPVRVIGEAVGNWYFEGTFPAVITDSANVVIGQAIVSAGGNWMTAKMVPFDVSITFNQQPVGSRGHIILKKDNPSGLAQNNASLDIPVIFK